MSLLYRIQFYCDLYWGIAVNGTLADNIGPLDTYEECLKATSFNGTPIVGVIER